jgi:CopG antitoxin of type II toxin-antitoxin system
VRFEPTRTDAFISLRVPTPLLATLRARATEEKMPTQRFIRIPIETQLNRGAARAKRQPAGEARVGGKARSASLILR